ncbi:MAG: 4-hydroxy-tetrahydrodipicolinate reductase [Gammaproteobacteria bacterium]|nr:4-hydroxy-tetrahydrodipicolinate reductase [Gammaproteobacteria bacterium]
MAKPIKVGVIGPSGRMGKAVCGLLLDGAHAGERAGLELVAAWSRSGQSAELPPKVTVTDDLEAFIQAVDIAIDFSRPETLLDIAKACVAAGKPLVSGTTGCSDEQLGALAGYAREVPVFHAANMSVGIALLRHALAEVASRLGEGVDVEIVESHHRHKVDAPSGTALALGEVVATARGQQLDEVIATGGTGSRDDSSKDRIAIHSIRAGEIVGEHDVRLVSAAEEIRLGHGARDRGAFAGGALRAARWLVEQPAGLYGLDDLLQLKE